MTVQLINRRRKRRFNTFVQHSSTLFSEPFLSHIKWVMFEKSRNGFFVNIIIHYAILLTKFPQWLWFWSYCILLFYFLYSCLSYSAGKHVAADTQQLSIIEGCVVSLMFLKELLNDLLWRLSNFKGALRSLCQMQ